MRYALAAMILVLVAPTANAAPTQAAVDTAAAVVDRSPNLVVRADSLSNLMSLYSPSVLTCFWKQRDYEELRASGKTMQCQISATANSIRAVFHTIRTNLRTMADFQIYQGILSELSLASAAIDMSSQRLESQANQMENRRVTLQAQVLTYVGLLLTISSMLSGAFHFYSRRKQKQQVHKEDMMNALNQETADSSNQFTLKSVVLKLLWWVVIPAAILIVWYFMADWNCAFRWALGLWIALCLGHVAAKTSTDAAWFYLRRKNPNTTFRPRTQSGIATWVGILERFLYVLSIVVGGSAFIGVWIALRGVSPLFGEDRKGPQDEGEAMHFRSTFAIFLIGISVSLVFGVAGGLMIGYDKACCFVHLQ